MKPIRCQRIFDDVAALNAHAARLVLRRAREAIVARGAFHLVLAGGETPRGVYRLLAGSDAQWPKWEIYFGDERCLPREDASRNDRMAHDAWLGRVPIPAAQVHAIPAELGAETAAARYTGALADLDRFDLVLLGLGEDGHTASLFPGHALGVSRDEPAALAVHGAPKPPPDRVSLSAWRLSRARQVVFLVSGAGKREALARLLRAEDIPAGAIVPPGGGVTVLVDRAAHG